jgi:hypothetical protein
MSKKLLDTRFWMLGCLATASSQGVALLEAGRSLANNGYKNMYALYLIEYPASSIEFRVSSIIYTRAS